MEEITSIRKRVCKWPGIGSTGRKQTKEKEKEKEAIVILRGLVRHTRSCCH
jgi:hypothetical protein